jgi:hypothetical protein
VELAACALVAGALAMAMLSSRLRAPLGADEGYLWFGVQQVLGGKMPHRDFKSYEPGRYFWSAAMARLFGAKLWALRISTHLFFAVGLFSSLLALREFGLGWGSILFSGAALTLWTHPQHKQFEHAWILLAWAVDSHMLLHPSAGTLAISSLTTGFALFFGFNLFLYFSAALALMLMVALLEGWIEPNSRMLFALVGGGLLGMLPFLLMLMSAGFARNFHRRRIASVFSRGTSNLPLPMPWPWLPATWPLQSLGIFRQRIFQGIFLAMFVVPACGLLMIFVAPGFLGPLSPAIVAASALGLLVSHHAASRADPGHIAQSIGPLCLLAILLTQAAAPASTALIVVVSLWAVWPLQALAQRRSNPAAFCRRLIGELQIDLPVPQARMLELATQICAARPGQRRGFFVAPDLPALYAMLSRDAPVYDTFCLYPADVEAQQEMIEAIEQAPVFAAIVSDAPTDHREDLRFSRTHPQVWAYLCQKFDSARPVELGSDVVLFTAKST